MANLAEMEREARFLMRTHGFEHVPFRWGRGKRRLGCVRFKRDGTPADLSLSRVMTELLPRNVVVDTIRHEVAHLIAGHDSGHGPKWKRAARQLGANPNRTKHVGDEINSKVAKYSMACKRCGETAYLNRRLKYQTAKYQHVGCGGTFGELKQLR